MENRKWGWQCLIRFQVLRGCALPHWDTTHVPLVSGCGYLRVKQKISFFPNLHAFFSLLICICLTALVLVVACRIFSLSCFSLPCGTWDLVPWPRMEHRPPALGVGGQSPSHWTTRKVPVLFFWIATQLLGHKNLLHSLGLPTLFIYFIWACRISVYPPEIEPQVPAVRVLSPSHWTAREFLVLNVRLVKK